MILFNTVKPKGNTMPIDNQPLPGIKPGSDQGQTTVVTPPAPLKKPSKENYQVEVHLYGETY